MSRCRSCEAPVVWAQTQTGKRIPLDAEDMGRWESPLPIADGNLRIARHQDGVPVVVIVSPALLSGVAHYRSHFATCPDADEWRRRA